MAGALAGRRRRGRLIDAERWFFPAAALYGALAVTLSVHGLLTGRPLRPGLGTVAGHAHELLFGYALAVVAGYLLGKLGRGRLALLFGGWLIARVLYTGFPGSWPASVANAAFAGLLVATVAPKFIRAAKKWRNRIIGPLIAALGLAVIGFHLVGAAGFDQLHYPVLRVGVLLFALLMLFMGGRIIAPAVAGAIERANGTLDARVQPRLEGALIVAMIVALVFALLPGGGVATRIALLIAAVLATVRLLRWRLWRCRSRPDLLCLGVGYAWLVVGLALLGGARLFGMPAASVATHAITVGALGTLSSAVMIRVRRLHAKLDPATTRALPIIVAGVGLAAALRIGGSDAPAALGLAAACWSLAMLLLLVTLLRTDPMFSSRP